MEVSEKLNILMELLNMKPRKFAELIGTTHQYLGNIRGEKKSKPGYDFLIRMFNALDGQINLEWFWYDRGTPLLNIGMLSGRTPALYLFGDVYPRPVNNLSTRHRTILRALGFSASHKLYSWKHTGAINAALAGVTLKELQIQLRHHSLDETDGYLRQLGYTDLLQLEEKFPGV